MRNDFRNEIDAQIEEVGNMMRLALRRKWLPQGSGYEFSLRFAELPEPLSFELLIADDFLNWRIESKLDHFSAPLLALCQQNLESDRDVLGTYLKLADERSRKFDFLLNGEPFGQFIPGNDLHSFSILMVRPFNSASDSMPTLRSALIDTIVVLLTITRDVTTNGEIQEDIPDPTAEWELEGASAVIACRKYERSRFNRQLCLNFYGYRCLACGLLLAEKYGKAGESVVHVHHLLPVSMMGGEGIVNPLKDLVPLCPNCHNVAHGRKPPFTLEELRTFIATAEN